MEVNYNEFMPEIVSNESLLDEGSSLENGINNLKDGLNNASTNMLKSASDEVSRIVEELEENQLALNTSLKLVKIDSLMQKIKLLNESKNFKEVNNVLNSIQLLLGDPDDKIIRRLDIYNSLKAKLSGERENMLKNLAMQFDKLVQTKIKTFPKNQSVTMIISKNVEELSACINALLECDYSFKVFIEFCMINIFEPIVSRAVSLDVKENESDSTMLLSYSIEPVSDDLRPGYENIFLNLRTVLFYFQNLNVPLKNGSYFLTEVFATQKDRIYEMIFDECLTYNIPKTIEDKNRSTINMDITKLSKYFIELHFFDSIDEEELIAYCQKIDNLFLQRFTNNIQELANELLKRDLHDMILISDDASLSTTTPLIFPKSMISKSTLELIKLLEKIMRQIASANDDNEKKKVNLLESIKSMLDNYAFTVQVSHSQLLSKIPQQAALFYNNCMYLSNWASMNDEFRDCKIDQVIEKLKGQGAQVFECQVAKQKIQLLEVLKDFGELQILLNVLRFSINLKLIHRSISGS